MKPAFFVQNNHVDRLTAPVALYARANGIACEDRSSHADFDADDCGIDWGQYDVVLPYGSVQFIRQLKASSLLPFVHHDEDRFCTAKWAAHLGEQALNGSGGRVRAGDMVRELSARGRAHLRPDSVDKAFAGGVFDVTSWAAVASDKRLADDLVCWVSPVAQIDAEWRCWVIGGELVCASQYQLAGAKSVRLESSPDLLREAQWLANMYAPADCFVVDVAKVGDALRVIEYNPIHCSGCYAADVGVVLGRWMRWSCDHLRPNQRARNATQKAGLIHP